MNYYDILEVSINSSKEVIKASYKALALKYHPDKNGNTENKSYYENKMKQINQAYSVLSDDIKRAEYDRANNIVRKSSNYNAPEDEYKRRMEEEARQKTREEAKKKAEETKKKEAEIKRKAEYEKNRRMNIRYSNELYRLIYMNENEKKPTYIFQALAMVLFLTFAFSIATSGKENNIKEPVTTNIELKKPETLPSTGVYDNTSRDRVAPFEVRTTSDGNHYFIKLEDYYSGRTVMTFFIREGRHIDTTVPLGTYIIKYATGKEWYGDEDLFGSNTQYYKTDEIFEFEESTEGISGWTIELISQVGGNLGTDKIRSSDW